LTPGKTLAQQPAEIRVVFDQREPRGIDAAFDQGFRHRSGAGPEFDDRSRHRGIDIAGHDARERPARGRHGSDGQRLFDEAAEEAEFVALQIFLFEVAQAPADPAADRSTLEFDEAELPLEFALKTCQGAQRHGRQLSKYRRPLFGKPRGCDGQAANPSQLFVKLCRKSLPGATEQVFDLAEKSSRFRVRIAR
jgi:hypothetical protein